MGKYFQDGTCCLYLDQFAVSRIASTLNPPKWANIASLIKKGVNEGRLVCPTSTENMIEFSGMYEDTARETAREFGKIASGWQIYSEAEINANYLIRKIRGAILIEIRSYFSL